MSAVRCRFCRLLVDLPDDLDEEGFVRLALAHLAKCAPRSPPYPAGLVAAAAPLY